MITQYTARDVNQNLNELVALLQNVVDDGASIGFLLPLDADEAVHYWQNVANALDEDTKVMLVSTDQGQITGSVQLGLESRKNGRHRAEVQKLMVHTVHRRKGVAHQLMEAIEQIAQEQKRTLLVLDTREGDASEVLYQKRGYVKAGVIPRYVINEVGEFQATVLYYKILED